MTIKTKYYRLTFTYKGEKKTLRLKSDAQLNGFINSLDLPNTKDLRIFWITEQELHFGRDSDGSLSATFLE